ncbi:hypothetical protein KUV50_14845 [Membranicola marinus]|uniref:Uncharacterized protein n=1 Tax=Membranihabitans marinus TaxID=1227546 RepID=A0A953LCE3_9BACT|nr:hypothetical protein [Membranihabitans marinus]MBY5959426.1 hypothetical protein [Membranihabitans marinus]
MSEYSLGSSETRGSQSTSDEGTETSLFRAGKHSLQLKIYNLIAAGIVFYFKELVTGANVVSSR